MACLTYKLFLLAATVTSCGLAYVPNSNLKCECTCSPVNNPATKYSAVGNFEAAIKPKTDPGTSSKTTTEAVASLDNKVPTVPTLLQESPFKVKNDPKLDIFNYRDSNNKQSTSYTIKKETSVPLVQRFSSRPVTYSSRSTTRGLVSPTSASILPNSPIELKVTSSAFRKTLRTVSNNSTEPKESEPPKDLIDTKRIEELTKTEALTLDDIIFGKVPFDFGSRGIQRNFLTESETKALKDERSAQRTSTMNASITTKRSTTGTAAPDTVANEYTETAASETSTPVKKSTLNRLQPETSSQPETPTATTQSATTTVITTRSTPITTSTTTTMTTTEEFTTTVPTTTASTTFKTFKPISRRGLLPLFRTGYSPFTPAKPEKSTTVTNSAVPSTESSTKPTTSQSSPKTTTPSTTQKITTPSSTTAKRTTKVPTTTTTTTTPRPTTVTTQRPTTKRRPESQRQSSYNVNPSSPPARSNAMQRKTVSVVPANQVNPTYRFSDSFRKNTIRNLLDAFKPEYMKTLHEEEATIKPRPRQTESRQQHYVPPPPPSHSRSSPMMQRTMDMPFGHFEKTRSVDVPNHQLVHSMSSLSSMNSLQSSNSRQPSLIVLDSPAQEQHHAPYQIHDQHTQQEPTWNPIQEPKKWGEPKSWGHESQQQQQLHQSMNLQNHQLWNPQQNSIQKTQVFNPSFAISGQTQQQQQSRQGPFPGLQLNKSPIDFRVH